MTRTSRSTVTAMICAAAVSAQFVSGKATRDSLFLTSFAITTLPTMMMATSLCAILLVAAQARGAGKIRPATLVPASFVLSGLLFLGEWLFRSDAPSTVAVIVYLHVSGAGPLLASGFWLVASERFDPRTAKRRFGQIAGAGTLGGLLGAVLAERVAAVMGVPSMLLFLAAFQFLTAWLVRQLAAESIEPATVEAASNAAVLPMRSGLRVVAEAPHLRHLVAVVLLGTTSAALLDYLFQAKAVETFGSGDRLLRFFALYYAATTLVSFVLQTLASSAVLERFGLALMTSTPSIALLAGSIGGLVAPGFGSLVVARGGESIFRGSWFRAGYELFYIPIPADEKRAAKSVIDVAFDRLGDALGAGLVRLALIVVPAAASSAILLLAMASSLGAIIAASQLNRWYLRTLANSLIRRAASINLARTEIGWTAKGLLTALRGNATIGAGVDAVTEGTMTQASIDPAVQDIRALSSGNRRRVIAVLSRPDALAKALVPHVIPLLGVDSLAEHAVSALRRVAGEHVDELAEALLDPNQDYAVRRRLPRVLSAGASQRAVDGLLLALDDARFEVRFQSARALAAIFDKSPGLHVDRERIYDVVGREVAVGRPVWESRRLLDRFGNESPLDEFVRDRASQSLAHVFTLLSLVLPKEPLRIAFKSLHSDDHHLQGTALEFLQEVLPAPIRQRLWPFLVPAQGRRAAGPARQYDGIIADLLHASPSVTLHGIAGGWKDGQVPLATV